MTQKIIAPIDHGNRNMKTTSFVYTSGLEESDTRPPLGDYLVYKGKYYALTGRRIPYMRDKTQDDRFFILTLFGIAMECENKGIYTPDNVVRVDLPVGLPPKHYGAQYQKFEEFFKRDEVVEFQFHGKDYAVYIEDVMAFPQDYAAAITIFPKIRNYRKVIVIDIGGFTLDYLMLKGGAPDLSACDSLECGVIKLYNVIISRINAEYDILLEESDIDSILKNEQTDYEAAVIDTIKKMAGIFADDLLGTLRERGLDLKSGCAVFVGGGSLLLRKYLEESRKTDDCYFVEDLKANAQGYGILYSHGKNIR